MTLQYHKLPEDDNFFHFPHQNHQLMKQHLKTHRKNHRLECDLLAWKSTTKSNKTSKFEWRIDDIRIEKIISVPNWAC